MPRLNDQFMETLTHADGSLIVVPEGYYIAEHEQDGMTIDVSLNAYHEPGISVRGSRQAGILKGGIAYDEEGGTFTEGGLYQKGLLMEVEDEKGYRRYWITDSDEEAVLVAVWDPKAEGEHPTDGITLGRFGDYSPASQEDTDTVKETVKAVIDAGRIAINSRLVSS